MKLKIAVVQFATNPLFIKENLEKAEKFIQKAAGGKADIIVFPESFITRVGSIGGKEELVDSENKYRKYFQRLAKKYQLDIVPDAEKSYNIRSDLKK